MWENPTLVKTQDLGFQMLATKTHSKKYRMPWPCGHGQVPSSKVSQSNIYLWCVFHMDSLYSVFSMLVHDPYKLISGPSLSTNSRINNSYEKEMARKREGSVGLLCTNNSMGFSLKYDPCPQFLLDHSWESSIPDNLHERRAIPPKFILCGSSSLPPVHTFLTLPIWWSHEKWGLDITHMSPWPKHDPETRQEGRVSLGS